MNDVQAILSGDASTGVAGLDDILCGGLGRDRLFLLEGSPGTGKTTVALSFLREGAALGERGLYITLSETEQELRDVVSKYWIVDEIRAARIHANVPEAFAASFAQFAGAEIRDEPNGRKSVPAWLLSAHLPG